MTNGHIWLFLPSLPRIATGDGHAHHHWELLAGAGPADPVRGLQATHVRGGLRLDPAREHGRSLVAGPAHRLLQPRAAAGRGEPHRGLDAQQHRWQQRQLQRTGEW